MKKLLLPLVAAAGAGAAMLPASGGAAQAGPTVEGVTVSKSGVTVDTGIRCVTEPCPSHIVIPIPPGS